MMTKPTNWFLMEMSAANNSRHQRRNVAEMRRRKSA